MPLVKNALSRPGDLLDDCHQSGRETTGAHRRVCRLVVAALDLYPELVGHQHLHAAMSADLLPALGPLRMLPRCRRAGAAPSAHPPSALGRTRSAVKMARSPPTEPVEMAQPGLARAVFPSPPEQPAGPAAQPRALVDGARRRARVAERVLRRRRRAATVAWQNGCAQNRARPRLPIAERWLGREREKLLRA